MSDGIVQRWELTDGRKFDYYFSIQWRIII